ncbi:MAG: tetratricopeptide repeat protein [Proteobacteria bacterium]|nr:tetratricopeptide repeat protein [Pseudomonadota bacterium]
MSVGRNEPCPCGSGRKYKQCCGAHAAAPPPEAPAAVRLRALIDLLNTGQAAQAEAGAREALTSAPGDGYLWKVLGVAQLRQDKDARIALERAAELLPQDPESHFNLGAALRRRGEWEAALARFRQALILNPRSVDALFEAGDAQRALGRPAEAVALYQAALQIDPRRVEGYNNTGNALLELGRTQDAVRCYRKALELAPDAPFVLCNLADALRRSGAAAEALEAARRAVSRAPGLAAAHNVLGVILGDGGDSAEAVTQFREALHLDPQSVDVRVNLAGVLEKTGAPQEALALLEDAARRAPQRADVHLALARGLFEARRLPGAAESYARAVALRPEATEARLGLATTLRFLGQTAAAEAQVETVLAREPRHAAALTLLGELRADRGRFEEAQQLFSRALAAEPDFAMAYSGIAAHRRMQADDRAWRDGVERLLARPLAPDQEIALRTALGKFFDDTGEYDRAFESYRAANERGVRLRRPYDGARLEAHVGQLMALCDAGFVRGSHPGVTDSQRPLFIIGMPRSGTSLAEQILASHPEVHGAGEVRFWDRAFGHSEREGHGAAVLAQVGLDYLAQVEPPAAGATTITDKLPANFLYAGFIRAVIPGARFIHMQRHPLDTCLSVYFQSFFNVGAYASDLDSLAHYYRQYRRIMAHWRTVLPPQALLEVPYEGLVSDSETWSRRMLEFAGLPWDPAVLEFHRTERVVITASRWQVRQKLNRGSVDRWRHYERHLGPLMPLLEGAAP